MSDLDDFDLDIEPTPPKRKPGRPKGSKTKSSRSTGAAARKAIAEQARQTEEEAVANGADAMPSMSSYGNVEHAMKPLTAAQIAQVFRMDRKTALARMRGCPPVAKNTRGAFLYDLATAAGYLVEPKIDIESWIKRLRPNDLPPYLSEAYWSAIEKRQRVEIKAGDLWETEKVIEVYGELAKRIKSTVTLWPDQLEKTQKLTPEQREFFTAQCDGLLAMIVEAFTSLQEEQTTGNLQQKYADEATGQPTSETKEGDIE